MKLREPYTPRPIRSLGLWKGGDWRIKLYGLSYGAERPRAALVAAARALAETGLPRPAIADGRYGVGFMGVHQGRGADLVFVSWWANENELFHRVFASQRAAGPLEPVGPGGLVACVWDLAVIGFERQAWVETVLAAPVPDLEGYLAARFEGRV